MKILWACPLVEWKPRSWWPRINTIRGSPATGSFPCSWTTTDGNLANNWAIGVAEVTAAQLAAIQADPQIILVGEAKWGERLDQQPVPWRAGLGAFADRAGIQRAVAAEVVQAIFERIMSANELKDVAHLLREMRANFPGRVL